MGLSWRGGYGHSKIVDPEAIEVEVTGRGLHDVPYFVELVALIDGTNLTKITTKIQYFSQIVIIS